MAKIGAPPVPNRLLKAVIMTMIGKQSNSAEGRSANVRDTGNIDTVNDIVEKTHDLGYKHR